MTTRRTEITVETHQVLVTRRRGSLLEGWCVHCDQQVGMILVEEAALAGISLHAICRTMRAGRLHFTADASRPSFICLNSLLEQV
jgi:hypothetical protein